MVLYCAHILHAVVSVEHVNFAYMRNVKIATLSDDDFAFLLLIANIEDKAALSSRCIQIENGFVFFDDERVWC